MEPKPIWKIWYEKVACAVLGHRPKPFNGPFQDCGRCDKSLNVLWPNPPGK